MLPGASFASTSIPVVAGGPAFANTHSVRNQGTATATAGHVNFGQPAAWIFDPSAVERTFSFWFRYDDREGCLFGNRTYGVAQTHVYLSGGALQIFWGSNYAGGGSGLSDGNWHMVTWTTRDEGSGNIGRVFVDGSSTSVATTTAGTGTGTALDFIMGHQHGSTNSDWAFGEYCNAWFAHLTFWTTGFTGTQHTELYNSGVPIDPSTHSLSASLANYLPLGTGDTSPTLSDAVGSVVGTMVNTGSIAIEAVHP